MPLILHDYMGVGHDLSKGAFDSISVSKPGAASKLLQKYLPNTFKEAWRDLSTDYKTSLKSYQPSMWKKMWANFGTQGLLSVFRAGAAKYKVGRPIIHKWIAGIAASDATIGAIVVAAEVGLSNLLDTWGDEVNTRTIHAKKGQWIFIESDESSRRRTLAKLHPKKTPKATPNEKQPPKTKSVSLGFFIEPTAKNRVTCFSLDLGRAQEIEITQLLECDKSVALRLDQDERLSTLRELFFYKYDGEASTTEGGVFKKRQFFSGRRVLYNGASYILLFNKHGKSLLEDANGMTCIVDTSQLKRDFGESTPGDSNDHFKTVGKNNLYIGQWVLAWVRLSTKTKYDTKIELAVIHEIAPNEECIVYYALDGQLAYLKDSDLEPLSKPFQELYNAKKQFMKFRLAAIKGTKATERFAMGFDYPLICIGRDYSDALTTETPYEEPKKPKTSAQKIDTTAKTGNKRKDQKDFQAELQEKGLTGGKSDIVDVEYANERDSITGTVIVGLAVVAIAYALYAA